MADKPLLSTFQTGKRLLFEKAKNVFKGRTPKTQPAQIRRQAFLLVQTQWSESGRQGAPPFQILSPS